MPRVVEYFGSSLKAALSRINTVTFANLGSVTKSEVRSRPSRSEDTAHLVCQPGAAPRF